VPHAAGDRLEIGLGANPVSCPSAGIPLFSAGARLSDSGRWRERPSLGEVHPPLPGPGTSPPRPIDIPVIGALGPKGHGIAEELGDGLFATAGVRGNDKRPGRARIGPTGSMRPTERQPERGCLLVTAPVAAVVTGVGVGIA
jgi:hypothetical protein